MHDNDQTNTNPLVKPAIPETEWVKPQATVLQSTPLPDEPQLLRYGYLRRHAWPLFSLVLLLVLAGTYQWQHKDILGLQSQVRNLGQTITSQKNQITALRQEANRLSVTTAQGPAAPLKFSGDTPAEIAALTYGLQTPARTMLIVDNAKLTVNSALYAVNFGNTAYNGEGAILDMTISNTSPQQQSFDLRNLSLQLPNGTIEQSGSIYNAASSNPPILTIAASGSSEVIFAFSPLNPNVTAGSGYLRFTAPGSTVPVMTPVTFKAPLN